MLPNFASFQRVIMSICEITTFVIDTITQGSFFVKYKTTAAKSRKAISNQNSLLGVKIPFIIRVILPYLNALAKPID